MLHTEQEQVLVAPTDVFHRLGYFQGFSRDVSRYLPSLLDPAHISYRPRAQMETDSAFKQLIPYCLFRFLDADGQTRLFTYTRGKGQGEGRLHSKRSVGVGGHISSVDAGAGTQSSPDSTYEEGMRRELEEELRIDTAYRQQCVGLINDDQTEVGRVHLGVVHLFDVERPDIRPRESDLLDCRFMPVDELLPLRDSLESWSLICLEALFWTKS